MAGRKIAWTHIRYHREMYLFIFPTILLIALFQYYPAASGIFHSFYRWNGADISEYVGLKNYVMLFSDSRFWKSFELAFTLGVWNVVKMIPALAVAVCINRCKSEKIQLFYRILFVIPMVIPGLVVVLIWRSFFFEATIGYLNRFLYFSHMFDILVWLDKAFNWGGIFVNGQNPAWLGDPKLIIVSCIVWGFPWVGSFAVLTYLAKLQSIPKDIYEAADVDGVNWWSKFTRIEFPLIISSIKLLLVFVIIETVKDAGMILVLAGMEGGPGGNVTVPALFMLRKAFIDQDMGFACAIGIVLTIVVITLQKTSNILTQWTEMRSWQKKTLQYATLAAAIGIFLSGRFLSVALALLVVSLPYEETVCVFRWLKEKARIFKITEEEVDPYEEETMEKDFLENPVPEILMENKVSDIFLRCLKHLTIFLVLFAALIPFYLMLIVSLKTNNQFYSDPVAITHPLMWGNWKAAYDSITPCLANSLVISISTTVCVLFVGLCAAYFFARYRMPMSGFLWNSIIILMIMPAIASMIPLFCLLRDISLLNTLQALIIVGTSGGQVFAIFVLRSFVEDIPLELFEAAEIDGANHFQQMRIIVMPLAGPILGAVGVVNLISQWNDFILPLIVIRDHAKLPVMVQLFRMTGEYVKLWGPLMAGYAIASIPVIILFICTMKLVFRHINKWE